MFILIGLLIASFTIWWLRMGVSSGFATEVYLVYNYMEKKVSLKITNENDILVLKEVLKGRSFHDSPSCGFTMEVSIIMANGKKSIVFCPANDGCAILRINESGRYINISNEEQMRLYTILNKYGMKFPCI